MNPLDLEPPESFVERLAPALRLAMRLHEPAMLDRTRRLPAESLSANGEAFVDAARWLAETALKLDAYSTVARDAACQLIAPLETKDSAPDDRSGAAKQELERKLRHVRDMIAALDEVHAERAALITAPYPPTSGNRPS